MVKDTKFWIYTVISELAFYAFLYYLQILLNVQANLWVSSLILWVLMNLSIVFCPVLDSCMKK